jgi:hypothetical protein
MYSSVILVIHRYPCSPVVESGKKNNFLGIKSVPIQGFEKALRTQLTQRSPLAVG